MPEFDVLLDDAIVRWTMPNPAPDETASTGSKSRSSRTRPTPVAASKRSTTSGEVPERAEATLPPEAQMPVRGPLPTSKHTLADPYLLYKAQIVDDLERARMANENRLRMMVRSEADSDGEERGWGLSPTHPEVVMLSDFVDSIKALEKEAVTNLQKAMRRHPLWSRWGQFARGVGEKQLGRLLAQIGDPYLNVNAGTTRRVSSLWAYCGLHVVFVSQETAETQVGDAGEDSSSPTVDRERHVSQEKPVNGGGPELGGDADQITSETLSMGVGVAPRRRRGVKANWSTQAKVRAYLIAESTVKQRDRQCEDGHVEECACSRYRLIYDQRRAHTAVTHGPDAEIPWTKGHCQNDALRIVSKAILKDLWRAARDWHIAQELN